MRKLIAFTAIACSGFAAPAQINLSQGLVACYPFNGNANDLSGNNLNGVVNGAMPTSDRFNSPNSAYDFNGVNSNIDLGLFSNFYGGNEVSVSVWIQANQVKPQTIIMMNPDDLSDRFNAMAYYSHNGTSTTFWDYGDISVLGGGRLALVGTLFSSLWENYIYISSDLLGIQQVYKNGVLQVDDLTASVVNNRNRNLFIGGGFDNNNVPFFFDGKIDDIRIYDRILSQAEITALQGNAGCSTTGLPEALDAAASIAIFPNPAEEGFFIATDAVPAGKNGLVAVHDMAGRTAASLPFVTGTGNVWVDASRLAPGMYWVSVNFGNIQQVGKLVVAR